MENIETVGYQLLIDIEDKEDCIYDENGILISANSSQHSLMSGIVLKIGSMAKKEDPEISIGDRVYFYEMDLKTFRIRSKNIGIITTNNIKIVEKLSK